MGQWKYYYNPRTPTRFLVIYVANGAQGITGPSSSPKALGVGGLSFQRFTQLQAFCNPGFPHLRPDIPEYSLCCPAYLLKVLLDNTIVIHSILLLFGLGDTNCSSFSHAYLHLDSHGLITPHWLLLKPI